MLPIGLDTDVNASAIGEATYGVTKGLDSSIYITVGTGIGVGVILDGKAVHGMQHPEAGHILLSRHPEDTYAGRCPYHGNCLEGNRKLLSGSGFGGFYIDLFTQKDCTGWWSNASETIICDDPREV